MTPTKACLLKKGDMVDLVDDEYVLEDDRIEYEFEFAEVFEVCVEDNEVTVGYMNGDIYVYPTDHILMVDHNAPQSETIS
jgi:hypothetical protein